MAIPRKKIEVRIPMLDASENFKQSCQMDFDYFTGINFATEKYVDKSMLLRLLKIQS
jgi:hypothetical protein